MRLFLAGSSAPTSNVLVLSCVTDVGKNMRYLVEREYKIDVAVHTVMKNLLDSKQESQDHDTVDEASTLELLAHVLRVYLRFFDYERDHNKSGANLHERCRAIGICAALQAFEFPNTQDRSPPSIQTARCTSPLSNANQSDGKLPETTPNSKLRAKMQLAKILSRTADKQQPSHGPERETLCALARALLRHAPCHC